MGETVDDASCALGPEDLFAVGGIPGHEGGHKPERDKKDRHPEGGQNALHAEAARSRPPAHGQQQRHDMHEDDGSLGIDAEPERRSKGQPVRQAGRGHRADPPEGGGAGHHGQHQDAVEIGLAAEEIERDHGAQNDDRRIAELAARTHPVGQPSGQPKRQHAQGRGHQSRGIFADTGQPDQIDQPEQQRRFVTVGHTVLEGHQPVIAGQHFPGDPKIARLVRGHHRPHHHVEDENKGHDQQDDVALWWARCRGHLDLIIHALAVPMRKGLRVQGGKSRAIGWSDAGKGLCVTIFQPPGLNRPRTRRPPDQPADTDQIRDPGQTTLPV